MIRLYRAREPVAQIVLCKEDAVYLFPDLRLVLFQPHELRQRPHGRGRVHCLRHDRVKAVLLEPVYLPGTALIRPEYRAADHVSVPIQQHRRVRRRVRRERGYLPAVCAGLLQHLRKRRAEGPAPVLRVLLAPAHPWVIRRVFASGSRGYPAVLCQQRQLHGAAAYIRTQYIFHIFTVLNLISYLCQPAHRLCTAP